LARAQLNRFSIPSSGAEQKHPLQFLNYKDGNQYDVAPVNFVLTRSIESPMLYNYTIQLKAYNLRSINKAATDVGDSIIGDRKAVLGLDGVKSVSWFNGLHSVARGAMGTIAATAGLVSVLGG